MLARKVLASTAREWFGQPLRQIHNADLRRWDACVAAARRVLNVRGHSETGDE